MPEVWLAVRWAWCCGRLPEMWRADGWREVWLAGAGVRCGWRFIGRAVWRVLAWGAGGWAWVAWLLGE